MDALGGYVEPASHLVGDLIFVATLLLTALLERLQFRLRATEKSRWWASNGRDVLNAVAVVILTLGLRRIGFTGPIALCIGGTLVLLLSALQLSLGQHPHSTWLSVAASFLLGAPVLGLPETVHQLFRAMLEGLF